MTSSSKRIYFVDFARSFAIMLALTDHGLIDFQLRDDYSPQTLVIVKTLTTSATPTFILLFGMMLEIIYLGKLRKVGIRATAAGLVNRSFQCYIGYFLTVVAGVIGGLQLIKGAVAATFFFGNCHLGNILKIYTILLIVAIPLLWFRNRFGIWWTVLLGFSPWLLYPLFRFIPDFHNNVEIFTSYVFGIGNQGGPSIMLGLPMVCLGMLAASFISFEKRNNFQIRTMGILAVLYAAVIMVFLTVPLNEIHDNYIFNGQRDNIYRDHNHPIYYLFSTTLGLTVAFISSLLIPVGSHISKATHVFLAFGRSSLTAFTVGNIFLNLTARKLALYQWNELAVVAFVIGVFLILLFYEKVYPRLSIVKKTQQFFRGLTVRYHWFYVRKVSNVFVKVLA
jgi:hypothetical protein